jgi:hypothetical protein
LRKRREETEVDEGPKSLYQVLPEKESRMRGFMGSDRVYDVSGLSQPAAPPVLGQEERGTKRKAGAVDVALDAADLEGLSEAELAARYEQASKQGRGAQEDFSDMAAAEMAKRRKTGAFSLPITFPLCTFRPSSRQCPLSCLAPDILADSLFSPLIAENKKKTQEKEKFKF